MIKFEGSGIREDLEMLVDLTPYFAWWIWHGICLVDFTLCFGAVCIV